MTVRAEIKDVILHAAQRVVEKTSGGLSASDKRKLREGLEKRMAQYEGPNPILGVLGQWDAGADAGEAATAATDAALRAQRGHPALSWDDELGKFRAPITDLWSSAIRESAEEAAEEYFRKASVCFDNGQREEATEHLCSAVICTIAALAAVMGWPHRDREDDLNAMIGIATGALPGPGDSVYEMLGSASKQGQDLNSAFAAAMGQPTAVRSGAYDDAGRTQDEVTMFARDAVTLAGELGRRLA